MTMSPNAMPSSTRTAAEPAPIDDAATHATHLDPYGAVFAIMQPTS